MFLEVRLHVASRGTGLGDGDRDGAGLRHACTSRPTAHDLIVPCDYYNSHMATTRARARSRHATDRSSDSATAQTVTERRIAEGIKKRREALGLSGNDLAERTGVSRAMVSKIERLEVSPTAVLLGRLCNGLGMTLSSLIASAESGPSLPIARASAQPVWRDPETGLRRTMVSPLNTGSRMELVQIELPSGAEVKYGPQHNAYDQHVWVLQADPRSASTRAKSRYRQATACVPASTWPSLLRIAAERLAGTSWPSAAETPVASTFDVARSPLQDVEPDSCPHLAASGARHAQGATVEIATTQRRFSATSSSADAERPAQMRPAFTPVHAREGKAPPQARA